MGKSTRFEKHLAEQSYFLESGLSQQEVEEIAGGPKSGALREDQSLEITLDHPDVGKEITTRATQFGNIPMFNQQPAYSLEEGNLPR